MRRQSLIDGLDRIYNDLNDSGVIGFFISKSDESSVGLDSGMKAFQKFSNIYSNYSENEIKILNKLGLSFLNNHKFWTAILTGDSDGNADMEKNTARIVKMSDTIPIFCELLKQNSLNEYVENINSVDGVKSGDDISGKSLLSIMITEDNQNYTSPRRILTALQSIVDLYYVHAVINKSPESDLAILSCDSGSDKSFDFLGLAETIKQLKITIEAIWDRVVFYRERKTSDSMKLFAETLPIYQKIESMANDESLSREQAALLKRKLYSGTMRFIDAGVTTPELDELGMKNPKLLMKPKQELLVAPNSSDSSSADNATDKKSTRTTSLENNATDIRTTHSPSLEDNDTDKKSTHASSLEDLEAFEKYLEEKSLRVSKSTHEPNSSREDSDSTEDNDTK